MSSLGWRRSSREGGLSLLETLVALALVSLALLLAMPLLALEVRLDRRLEARREVRVALELAVEAVRASADPSAARLVPIGREMVAAKDLAIGARLLPEPGGTGLYRLEAVATWKGGGRDDRLEVTTLMWIDK